MDTLPILEFDIRGLNPNNKIQGEEWELDPTCPWIIPNGSPFFGQYPKTGEPVLFMAYDQDGRELKRDQDYWLEEEFIPLSDVCNREIMCFVRTSDEVRANNRKIKINYVSVGAYFIPRNNLEEWMSKLLRGKIPIDFNEKVLGVPPTLPSEWHAHSGKTEIGDWFEFTLFFKYLAENVSTRKGGEVSDELDVAAREAFDRLVLLRDTNYSKLRAHQDNYNKPHGILPAHVNMGNHPNYGTGTIADHLAGTSDILLAHPLGVQEIVKTYTPNVKDAMRNGMVSLSKYGEGTYIPPNVTGSFEGLGSLSECMGMCIERDGRCVIIQNHFDGRNEGLYFSVLDDATKGIIANDPYKFEYTNYKYEPPVLANIGVIPNHIVNGSGNDIIMVGKTTIGNPAANDRWFIALTNDDFDPSAHRFVEVSMANVFAQCGNPNANGKWNEYFYHAKMTINLLGEWAYLVVDSYPSANLSYQGRMSHWRVPRANLINGIPSTWELVRLTYQDADGIQRNNAQYWEYAQKTPSANMISRWGRFVFSSPIPQSVGYHARRILTLFAKKSGTTNIYYMNWIAYTFLEYTPPGTGLQNAATITNMVYELNVDTGVMTLVYKQPDLNLDYAGGTAVASATVERNKWIAWYNVLVRYLYPATIVLNNGRRLSSITGQGQESSVLNSLVEYSSFVFTSNGNVINTKEDMLKGSVGEDRVKQSTNWAYTRNIQTPIPIGISNRSLSYDTSGEVFMTFPVEIINQAAGLQAPQVVCRDVSGGYAVRPEVTNTTQTPLYSRPLTNNVYKTNLTYQDPGICITGTAAELASRGVEAGNMSLSSCAWSSDFSGSGNVLKQMPSPAFQAPDKTGAVLTFPKTHTRTLDALTQTMKYTPTSFYGISQAAKDKIRNLIAAGQQGQWWCFGLHMINAESGPMFAGLNKAILIVKYPTQADGTSSTWDGQVFWITPVVEAPNSSHPGCHLITDFQVNGSTQLARFATSINTATQGAFVYTTNRCITTIYRNGDTLQVISSTGLSNSGGGTFMDINSFDVSIASGAISNFGTVINSWHNGEPLVIIPKVGRSRHTVVGAGTYTATLSDVANTDSTNDPSGGAARIYPVMNGASTDYYAVITAYPQTSWSIFILETVDVMFSGTSYTMPMGNIDLRDIDGDPRNKVFYMYATMEGGKPQYLFSDTELRQTAKMLLAAIITTGENQILLIERRQPFLIGDLEFSYSRKGGVIPVSSGFPQDEGSFIFLRAAELLP